MASGTLQRIDDHPLYDAPGEIRAFLVVRNETPRLPSTLAHQRALGVHRFVVVDNGSTGGTLDLLAAEKEVLVFTIAESYAGSHRGVHWVNAMLNAFGDGHWTLTIDADEQLIYPHHEELALPLLCRYLDHIQALFCLLLDMYADRPVAEAELDPAAGLIDTCRYFDAGDYHVSQIALCPLFGDSRRRARISRL